jgi:hypothetical protein
MILASFCVARSFACTNLRSPGTGFAASQQSCMLHCMHLFVGGHGLHCVIYAGEHAAKQASKQASREGLQTGIIYHGSR